MGIIGWLILSFGAFGAVCGSKCIPATAMCSHYWVKIEPHRNLMESEEELNSWCGKQSLFFRCLEDVLLMAYRNYSKLPTAMLVSKMFTEDLCLKGSKSRQRYLDNAACINQLNTDFCTLPEYLELLSSDNSIPPTKCFLAEKTSNCITASIVARCGFDAGRVYRHLSKVTNYGEEVCGRSGATCEEMEDFELSEIFYGLVHRIGRLHEQATEVGSTEDKEPTFESGKSTVTEAISQLYTIDSSEDISSPKFGSDFNEITRSKDEFRKKPVIAEPFKGLLFYNYSNEEFVFYWRQPAISPLDRVTCENLFPSHFKISILGCYLYYKHGEPEFTNFTEEEEKITPELIRDIDLTIPEDSTLNIGESPDWAKYLREYKRHRISWEMFFNKKLLSEDKYIRIANEELAVELPNSQVCINELRFYDILNDHYIDWWQCPSLFSDELMSDILTFLFPNRTRHTDFLFMSSNIENDTNGQFTTYVHLYEPLFQIFEKIACEKVNEHHPRGRGVWKCLLERRGMEGCDTCCVQFPYDSEICPTKQRTQGEVHDGKLSPELSKLYEGSGSLEEQSSTEASTFMVNEVTTSSDESANFVTGLLDDSEDLLAVDNSEQPNIASTDVMFMEGNSDDTTDLFVVEPDDFLSIAEEEILHDGLTRSELRMLNNNLVLKSTQFTTDGELYEIIEFEQ